VNLHSRRVGETTLAHHSKTVAVRGTITTPGRRVDDWRGGLTKWVSAICRYAEAGIEGSGPVKPETWLRPPRSCPLLFDLPGSAPAHPEGEWFGKAPAAHIELGV
jgi:hypothetical protein